MGTVYLAEQKEPVRRRVALKVIKLGMDSKQVVARFAAEQQALAMMEHDSIAKVFEVGTTERGQPYFVMEHVPGLPITEHCDKHRLSTKERLRLFQQVCAGVQHAHQKGVIHRDLKPSNILVSLHQGQAVPKIIDFGVARATDHRLVEATIFTEEGRMIGTPEYMSPEQAEMSSQNIDTRTDIYSLGVILYQLLVGELPFSAAELREAGLLEIQRVIREREPPKPSTRVTTRSAESQHIANLRATTSGHLLRELRGDLDWIVMMAMEKDRSRRYGTANELATDLERHLAHEPVMAGAPSAGYRLRKLVRRYRSQFVAATIVFVTLVAGLIGTLVGLSAEQVQRRAAQQNLSRFNVVANVVRLARARAEEQGLYPAWPDKIEDLRTWLRDYGRPIADELPMLEEALRALRTSGQPSQRAPSNSEKLNSVTKQRGELVAERGELVAKLDELRASHENLRSTEPMRARADAYGIAHRIAALDTRMRSLGHRVEQDWSFDFSDDTDQFLHDTLTRLVEDLRIFSDPDMGELASAARRLAWAERIETWTLHHPNARATWEEARVAIAKADGVVASEMYARKPIDLRPQIGLVPVGMNPKTRLWEFYHLRSAWDRSSGTDPSELAIPEHSENGRIRVTEETGIVFVLLPGARMDIVREGPEFDPWMGEVPVFRGEIAPVFLARHEITQGQWLRLHGDNPSTYKPGGPFLSVQGVETASLAHPVESVDWTACRNVLEQHGLSLPRQEEWQYACQAGVRTPWHTGNERTSLKGFANLRDRQYKKYTTLIGDFLRWDDGFVEHAPVGSFGANDFGLYDMHGNVWEWCADQYLGGYVVRARCGGSFEDLASNARCDYLGGDATPSGAIGVRPARQLR